MGFTPFLTKSEAISTTQLLLYFLCVTCVMVYIQYKWKRRKLEKLGSQLPGPKTIPILGNGHEFIGRGTADFFDFVMEWSKKYPSPFRAWLGPHLFVVVYQPEDLQIILKSPKSISKDPLYKFLIGVGEGLFSAPEEKWRRNRKIIAPAFNTRLIESFFPVFNEKNRYLVKCLEREVGKGEFDALSYIQPMNMDVICRTAMGVEVGAQDNPKQDFLQALARGSKLDFMRMYTIWLHPDFMWNIFGPKEELKEIYKQLFQLPLSIITKRRAEFRERKLQKEDFDEDLEGKKWRKSFLDILLELSDEGANFTDADLRDEVITMIIGGMETSALTNSFCLLMLAMHPDVQEKVYNEVMETVGHRDVTLTDCSNLTYLEMVLKETLRKFPIGSLLLRQNKEELPLTTCTLPPGCTIAYSPYRLHHLPEIYPEPMRFIPERFTPEEVAKRHPFSWIPFSGGPRGCIGSKYAMLSMKITIANVVRSYKLETTRKMEDIKLAIEVVLRSVNGFPISITRRE